MNVFIRICRLKSFSLAVLFLARDGQTWRSMGNAVDTGARSTAHDLTRLRDGRLALTYAQRDRAQICAKLSADEGATGPETGTSVIRALRRWPAGNGVVLG